MTEDSRVEAVLAEWAGIDPAAVATTAAPAAATEAAPVPSAAAETEPAATDDAIEVLTSTRASAADDGGDDEDAIDEDALEPARSGGYPMWLAAAFVIIPLLAVAYILIAPNGPSCGTGGQLEVDPATGLAVNCDGSEYGSSTVDWFALGGSVYTQCTACHGENGEGVSAPAFAGGAVLATFPAGMCADHIEWVTLGSAGWPEPTYGATNKPVNGGGVMPAFGATLTEEQLAAVVLYERVQFGGEPLEEAEIDCGLVVPEGETGVTDTTEATTGG